MNAVQLNAKNCKGVKRSMSIPVTERQQKDGKNTDDFWGNTKKIPQLAIAENCL